MRIAVFHNLPPGGARRAAFELVRATAHNHEFDLFTIETGQSRSLDSTVAEKQDISPLAGKVFRYGVGDGVASFSGSGEGQFRRGVLASALFRAHREIARDIDAGGYDIAFLHHDQVLQSPGLLRFLKTPSVYYMQEPRRQSFEYEMMFRHRPALGAGASMTRFLAASYNVWFREAEIKAARSATQVVVNSFHSLEFVYRAYGRYPVVSYLGVDPSVFTVDARVATAARCGVVAVGALDGTKGHGLAIEGLSMVPAGRRPPLSIVFERERPGVRSRLTSLAAKLGVELVLRSGITDEDLVRLYGASVATICTASVEPFGLTTVESLAVGTPVVAVCEGGYREVVQDGDNGYLAARDPGSLAHAIEQVLSVPDRWDPQELRASVLPFFSWEAAGSRIDGVFCDVAAGRQPVGALVPRR